MTQANLLQQIVPDLCNLTQIFSSFFISSAHQDVRKLVLLTQSLPLLLYNCMALPTLHRWITNLYFRNFVSSEVPVCSQKPQFASRFDRFVLSAVLQVVDLGPEVILNEFNLLNLLEILLLGQFSQLNVLLALRVAYAMLPLRKDQVLDVLGRKVRHPLLNLIEKLVFEQSFSCERFLRHFQAFDLILKLLNLISTQILG